MGVALHGAWARLGEAVARPRLKWAGILSGLGYAFVYLFSLGHLIVQPGLVVFPGRGAFFVVGLENLWRERAPWNWEPVAVFQPVEGFALFLSMPNLLLAAGLGTLLALNVTASIHLYTEARHCGLAKSASGILASAPAFLTGFACCAPTFLLALGTVSAGLFLALVPFLLPAAFAALGGALAWNLLRSLPAPPRPSLAP